MKLARSAEVIGLLFRELKQSPTTARGIALGGLLALTAWSPAANAIPTLSAASNLAVPATTAGIYINVVTGASGITPAAAPGWDINPWGSTGLNFFTPTATGSATGGSYVSGGTASSVSSLTAGSIIGSAATFTNSGTAVTFGSLANQWALNSTNYFGFRFVGDDTLLHYGYASMIVGATATARSIGQIWYESAAGASITIPAVPEPSSVAMMLAGGALAGAVVRRRRRADRTDG